MGRQNLEKNFYTLKTKSQDFPQVKALVGVKLVSDTQRMPSQTVGVPVPVHGLFCRRAGGDFESTACPRTSENRVTHTTRAQKKLEAIAQFGGLRKFAQATIF